MKFSLVVFLFFTFFIIVNLVQYLMQRPDFMRRVQEFFSSLLGEGNNFKTGGDMKKNLLVFLAVVGLVIFGVVSFGWIDVHPTEVAVEINKVAGKVSEKPLGVGYHFYNRWITDMVIYKGISVGYLI